MDVRERGIPAVPDNRHNGDGTMNAAMAFPAVPAPSSPTCSPAVSRTTASSGGSCPLSVVSGAANSSLRAVSKPISLGSRASAEAKSSLMPATFETGGLLDGRPLLPNSRAMARPHGIERGERHRLRAELSGELPNVL